MGKVKTKPPRGAVKRNHKDSPAGENLSSYIPEQFLYDNEEKLIATTVSLNRLRS